MRHDRTALFWFLQFGGWSAFFLAMFVAGISHWPVAFSAVHKSSLAVIGFAISLVLRSIYRALQRRGVPLPWIAALSAPLSFAAAAPWMVAHHLAVDAYRSGADAAIRSFPNAVNTIYYSFVLIAWSVLYFAVQTYLERQDDRERLLRAEALAHEARIDALRLQLNPHFLFNALNGVSTLIAERRNDEANSMLQELSGFLRSALDTSGGREVSLAHELDFASRYLDIEKVRFGDRLRLAVEIEDDVSEARVPPMVLQPLIENAIRHGVASRAAGGRISIRAHRDSGSLVLSVSDDGNGTEASRGTGVGLRNTTERLRELYGEDSRVEFEARDGGTTVALRIPFREQRA